MLNVQNNYFAADVVGIVSIDVLSEMSSDLIFRMPLYIQKRA